MPEERANGHTKNQEIGPETKRSKKRRALVEFRQRVEDAINGNYLIKCKKDASNIKEIALWGVPLLPSANDEGTDIVLMKFLKAKHYKVHEAFTLLRKTLKWRGDFWPEEENYNNNNNNNNNVRAEPDNLWFSDGKDKEGRPLCYNLLGKKCHQKYILGEKSEDYLRWRVGCLEKGIGNLNFKAGGADSIIQIIDLENAPGPATKEVRLIYKKLIPLLHDHYPGVVYKNLIINVPAWFLTIHALNLRLITQRSKNKFVFVKPSKVTEALLKYATPENILVQYGGLKRDNDTEFSTDDKVLELNLKANSTSTIQIPINEAEVTVTWDVTVVGYEVTYKEEFIPEDDCSYKILLQKEKKMGEGIRNTFPIREPGKIVITIANGSFAKKKVFYRYKSRPSVPLYMFIKS